MSIRLFGPRATRMGLFGTASLALALGVTGCGGGKEGTDTAVVTVTEPAATTTSTASTSTPAPAATGSTPAPAAAAEPTKAAEAAPAAAAAPATAEGWGTIKGRVVLNGDAPAPKILVKKDDPEKKLCNAVDMPSDQLVVDPKTKGVRYALVWIPKPTAVNKEAESAAKGAEVVFNQKGCVFIPHVIAAMKGATVTVKSEDAVGHNANSRGLISNRFNMTTQPMSSQPYALKGVDAKPGEVGCDIHPWMQAYWLVLNNPYFAVTDAEGNFEIKNAPAGDQKVVVWAEALGPGYVTAPTGDVVNIKAGGETTKDYTIDVAKLKLK